MSWVKKYITVSVVSRLVAILLLFMAIGRYSRDFYAMVHLIVCAVSAYTSYIAYKNNQRLWMFILAGSALLFNPFPFAKFHFTRNSWEFINFAVALTIIASLYYVKHFAEDGVIREEEDLKGRFSGAERREKAKEISVDLVFEGIDLVHYCDYEKAIVKYNTAIKMDPESHFAYHHRGQAYAKLEQHGHAIDDFNKALLLYPNYDSYYYDRAKSNRALGREEQAINDMKVAAKLGNEEALDFLRSQGINT